MPAYEEIRNTVDFISQHFGCRLCIHRLAGRNMSKGFANLPRKHQSHYCMALKRHYPGYERICFEFDGPHLRRYFRNTASDIAEKRCPMGVVELVFAIRNSSRLLGVLFAGPFRSPGVAPELWAEKEYDCTRASSIRKRLPELSESAKSELKALCSLLAFRLAAELGSGNDAGHDYRSRIEDYVLNHLTEQFGPEELAQELGLSISHTTALVQRNFGLSLIKLVNEYRIEESKMLLLATDFTIEYIARHCGFRDPGYFHRVFRRYTGQSPRCFRMGHAETAGESFPPEEPQAFLSNTSR